MPEVAQHLAAMGERSKLAAFLIWRVQLNVSSLVIAQRVCCLQGTAAIGKAKEVDEGEGVPPYELRLYSLESGSFGRVLQSRPIRAAHCLTSIQFSPCSQHIMLAYGRSAPTPPVIPQMVHTPLLPFIPQMTHTRLQVERQAGLVGVKDTPKSCLPHAHPRFFHGHAAQCDLPTHCQGWRPFNLCALAPVSMVTTLELAVQGLKAQGCPQAPHLAAAQPDRRQQEQHHSGAHGPGGVQGGRHERHARAALRRRRGQRRGLPPL